MIGYQLEVVKLLLTPRELLVSIFHCLILIICYLDSVGTYRFHRGHHQQPALLPIRPLLDSLVKHKYRTDIPISESRSIGSSSTAKIGHIFGNYGIRRRQPRAICECGEQKYVPLRIHGGTEPYPDEYPWMVAIVSPDGGSVICGASLIAARFALTAAHCFRDEVVASVSILIGDQDLREAMRVPVLQVVVNPIYSRITKDHDLALVEFGFPVAFDLKVSPLCLPVHTFNLEWQEVIVMGWGETEFAVTSFTLQEVTLLVIPNSLCQRHYPTISITEGMICAWGDSGKDACRGDSGGPLVWNSEGRWFVVGLVAFGEKCGSSTAPGVYTRVDMMLDWILTETENAACLAPQTSRIIAPYSWATADSRIEKKNQKAQKSDSVLELFKMRNITWNNRFTEPDVKSGVVRRAS